MDWTEPLPEDHNGVIRQYLFTLHDEDDSTEFNTSDLFIELENLRPGIDYMFSISAVTVGPGPLTNGTFNLPPFRVDGSSGMYINVSV